ncbi:CoA ester lyase [Sphingorhabdus sp.]|jgi:(3S)-malyl-CoA thioesterase|uniref:HpcH/HpaI aldolase/citrate lyase family protein n=1 Tax=Sphingorhabdus sp. TaxID=1902408 RepID=UPI0035ADD63F|nr:CoA ester lyase [Sphingomonadaceae bacterium]
MTLVEKLKLVRTALYVPATNARALEKARGLGVDMLIIDLEDSVPAESKSDARAAAVEEVAKGFPGKLVAIRLNGLDSAELAADIAAVERSLADCFVLPKVEAVADLDLVVAKLPNPVLAMIEGPAGIYAAREIAAHSAVAGLIAGVNDICADMGIRPGPAREGLELALQSMVLAAAAAGKPAFDGVNNKLDDMSGLETECLQGRCYGFTGKTLIHPNQIAIANAAFGPTAEEIAEAEALIEAATGGAQRHRGRMIESMHVDEARRTIERARHTTGS